MKISAIFRLLLILTVCGCERQKVDASTHSESGSVQQVENSLKDLRERTHILLERAESDRSVYDSKEWIELKNAHREAYKKLLISCIQEADTISITEHSDSVDFYEPGRPLPEDTPFYEYQTVSLTADQKAAFLRVVEKMDTSNKENDKKCGFEPHHRLTFIRNDQKLSSMSICFACGEVVWEKAEFAEPSGLMEALRFVVESAGLKPGRDWRALTKSWSEQAGKMPTSNSHQSESEGIDKSRPESGQRSE